MKGSDRSYGARLEALRTEAGLGPYQAATQMGVRWDTLKAWERGRHPRAEGRHKISAFYKVDPITLAPLAQPPASDAAQSEAAGEEIVLPEAPAATTLPEPQQLNDLVRESEARVPERIRDLCVYLQGYGLTHPDLIEGLCQCVQDSVDAFIAETQQRKKAHRAPKSTGHSGGRT